MTYRRKSVVKLIPCVISYGTIGQNKTKYFFSYFGWSVGHRSFFAKILIPWDFSAWRYQNATMSLSPRKMYMIIIILPRKMYVPEKNFKVQSFCFLFTHKTLSNQLLIFKMILYLLQWYHFCVSLEDTQTSQILT